jgi:hypothetical protein
VIDDSTAYGQGLANEFEKKAKALGLKVLSHDATNDKAVDFRAILTKIKARTGRDHVRRHGRHRRPFAKQAKQLGLRAKIFAATASAPKSWPIWPAKRPTTSCARKPVHRSRRCRAAPFGEVREALRPADPDLRAVRV